MKNKVIVVGASGRMGKEVIRLIIDSSGFEVSAKVDVDSGFAGEGDVIIDFSSHEATEELISFALAGSIPVVIATTGHTEEEIEVIKEASGQIPIFLSANMSVGIALLCKLVKEAARVMNDGDIEIIEKHHNRKMDAPSGTALLIANAIKEVKTEAEFIYGRGCEGKRKRDEVGIHAVRSGNIVGEHEVMIGTDTQTITLKHEAHDRALFAEGALSAARYLLHKEPGLYDMEDMIDAN